MTAQEAFVTRLRRHRQKCRVSLEQMAAETHVREELLGALERNDLSAWPRGVYARSWIRAYAAAVGLDPDETVNEFCRLFPNGDRRAASTMQEIASIVAEPSDYRDEFSHPARRAADMPADAEPGDWMTALARARQLFRTRAANLRLSPSVRARRTPEASG